MTRRTPPARRLSGIRGFTLIEMLIVVALIGILATLAMPQYRQSVLRAKESVLRHDLWVLRDVIDQFYTDQGRYPSSLEELVLLGYIRRIPDDPMTGLPDWVPTQEELAPDQETPPEEQGITDVHSASGGLSLDQTSYYSEW